MKGPTMIEITDRAVDDTYRHGIADLIAHMPRPATEIRRRRVHFMVAMVGIAIPLAALAIAALVVIAGHAQHSTTPSARTAQSTSSSLPLGRTIAIGATVVPAADVTVEKVAFVSGSGSYQPPPANGLYAVADVRVSMPDGGVLQSPPAQYNDEEQVLSELKAQLQIALVNNDVARAHTLRSIIESDQLTASKLALALMPFNLVYVTSNGHVYTAWGGSSALAAFAPTAYSDSSYDGLTSLEVVFDVPSRGGVIQMTDARGRVVGRWQAPAM